MFKSNVTKFGIGLLIAFFAGRFTAPKNVQTRETENQRREQNVREDKKETRLPDGTVIIETRKEKETVTEKQKESKSKTESRPSYRVGLVYEPAIRGFQDVTYQVVLEKRILGELYVGVAARSEKTVGITLSLGF
jgi:hypothetical protein